MKKALYYSLILIAKLTIQRFFTYGQCNYDKTDPSQAICENHGKNNAFPDDILLNITKLKIDWRPAEKPWVFKSPNTLTRFSNLKELHIFGEFEFSKELLKTIDKLIPEFFNVKSLLILSIEEFFEWSSIGGNRKWTPPPFLERLFLRNCLPGQLDWKNVHTLEYVNLEGDYLPSAVSEVVNPSAASLKELRTKAIYGVIRISEIAFLCHLTDFSFDDNRLKLDNNYCECENYKKWQEYLSKEANSKLTYHVNSGGQLTCSSPPMDCSKYTLDGAIQNRTRCLSLPKPKKNSDSSLSSWMNNLYLYIIAGVILLGIFFVVALVVAIYLKSPDPAPVASYAAEPVDYYAYEEDTAGEENYESEE